MGSDQYPPIEDAPGTYVRETHATHAEDAGQAGQDVAQEATQGDPRKKEWDESEHQGNFEGWFGPGEAWDESTHTRDAKGRFT